VARLHRVQAFEVDHRDAVLGADVEAFELLVEAAAVHGLDWVEAPGFLGEGFCEDGGGGAAEDEAVV
jgi:hypothetical protein